MKEWNSLIPLWWQRSLKHYSFQAALKYIQNASCLFSICVWHFYAEKKWVILIPKYVACTLFQARAEKWENRPCTLEKRTRLFRICHFSHSSALECVIFYKILYFIKILLVYSNWISKPEHAFFCSKRRGFIAFNQNPACFYGEFGGIWALCYTFILNLLVKWNPERLALFILFNQPCWFLCFWYKYVNCHIYTNCLIFVEFEAVGFYNSYFRPWLIQGHKLSILELCAVKFDGISACSIVVF